MQTDHAKLLCLPLAVLMASAAGCITSQTINVGQKTALERQLIGELEPLSEEQLLLSSVRASGAGLSAPGDDQELRAVAARRRQLFNRDDLDELKSLGCVGEASGATLVVRTCEADQTPELAARRDLMIAQENEDRTAILDWVLASDPSLSPADRAELQTMYHRLLVEKARPGDWVQAQDGTWSRR